MKTRYCSLAFMGLLAGIADCRAAVSTPAPIEGDLIEFRLVEDATLEDSQQAVLKGERMNLGPTPVVSDADVQAIALEIRPGRLILSIQLTEKGQRKLRRVTAENIGRRMAFILDGQIRSAPLIRDTVSGNPIVAFPTLFETGSFSGWSVSFAVGTSLGVASSIAFLRIARSGLDLTSGDHTPDEQALPGDLNRFRLVHPPT